MRYGLVEQALALANFSSLGLFWAPDCEQRFRATGTAPRLHVRDLGQTVRRARLSEMPIPRVDVLEDLESVAGTLRFEHSMGRACQSDAAAFVGWCRCRGVEPVRSAVEGIPRRPGAVPQLKAPETIERVFDRVASGQPIAKTTTKPEMPE